MTGAVLVLDLIQYNSDNRHSSCCWALLHISASCTILLAVGAEDAQGDGSGQNEYRWSKLVRGMSCAIWCLSEL